MWRDYILQPDEPPSRKAFSVAAGLFSGILPLWGFQAVIAVGLAVIFRLNKPLSVIASNISIPPFIPLILYLSFCIGGLLTGQGWHAGLLSEMSFEAVYRDSVRYVCGAVALAVFTAVSGGLLTWWLAVRAQARRSGS